MKNTLLTTTAAASLLLGIAAAGAQSDRTRPMDQPPAAQGQSSGSPNERAVEPGGKTNRAGEKRDNNAAQSNPSRTDRNIGQTDRVGPDRAQRAQDSAQPSNDKAQAPAQSPSQAASPEPGRNQAQERPRRGNERADDRNRGQARDRAQDDATRSRPGDRTGQTMRRDNAPANAPAGTERTGRSNDPAGAGSQAQTARTDRAGAVSLSTDQRTRINEVIARERVNSVTNVNFSVSVGATVPRDVRLRRLPPAIVEIVPQYRGYDYVLVRDEIVIVEPRTHKIVTVISKSGGATTGARPRGASHLSLSREQREIIRKHATRRTARPSGVTVEVGERIPSSVELYTFPDDIYADVPALRTYRYFTVEDEVVLVDPEQHRIVEIID